MSSQSSPFPEAEQSQWQQWLADCAGIGVAIPEERQALFPRLYAMLLEANKTTNLTRITELPDFLSRHLLDSLALSPLIAEDSSVADIGSGAGFPALPLAIARPDLQIVAVESVGKKCKFIQETAVALGLENLMVCNHRSEAMAEDPKTRERFDVVTARAVASLPTLLELCIPLVRVKGQFLAMKGQNWETELAASDKALKVLATRYVAMKTFTQAGLEGSRILIFEKKAHTQDAYPRASGLPSKKPL